MAGAVDVTVFFLFAAVPAALALGLWAALAACASRTFAPKSGKGRSVVATPVWWAPGPVLGACAALLCSSAPLHDAPGGAEASGSEAAAAAD